MSQQLQQIIDGAWEQRADYSPSCVPAEVAQAVEQVIAELNAGRLRVATRQGVGQWTVNQWVKKAVLLSFRLTDNAPIHAGDLGFFDKVRTKFSHLDEDAMRASGVRVVPPAVARRGSFIGKGAVLMPSYVNIGAYVDEGTMVDTWATVGSCAQIGKGVHLSGGVGIGGVLEPVQAAPVIIGDGAFIGSRAIVVEGVHVGREAVLGANVVLTTSTRIIDITGPQPREMRGHVPPRSVVIPGTVPKQFPAGEYGVPCALIIGQRKESTDRKTSLNEVLREFSVAV